MIILLNQNVYYLCLRKPKSIQENKDRKMNEEGGSPLAEHRHGNVFNFPRRDEISGVDWGEARGPYDAQHGLSRLPVVTGHVDLLAALQTTVL